MAKDKAGTLLYLPWKVNDERTYWMQPNAIVKNRLAKVIILGDESEVKNFDKKGYDVDCEIIDPATRVNIWMNLPKNIWKKEKAK